MEKFAAVRHEITMVRVWDVGFSGENADVVEYAVCMGIVYSTAKCRCIRINLRYNEIRYQMILYSLQ